MIYDIFDVAVSICVKILPIEKCIRFLNTLGGAERGRRCSLDMEGRSGDGGVPWIWRGGSGDGGAPWIWRGGAGTAGVPEIFNVVANVNKYLVMKYSIVI